MTEIVSRDEQHPTWCIEHTHVLAGQHGECNGPMREALHDEHGAGLETCVLWLDPDTKPFGHLAYLASPNGEQTAELSVAAINLLVDLIDNHPDELAPTLRHLATTLRTDVTA